MEGEKKREGGENGVGSSCSIAGTALHRRRGGSESELFDGWVGGWMIRHRVFGEDRVARGEREGSCGFGGN